MVDFLIIGQDSTKDSKRVNFSKALWDIEKNPKSDMSAAEDLI